MKNVMRQGRFMSLAVIVSLVAVLSLSACGESTTASNPTTVASTSAATSSAAATTTAASTSATAASPSTAPATRTVAGTSAITATTAATTSASTTTTTATTSAGTATTVAATGGDTTPKVVEAANAFIATLDSNQKAAGLFDFSNTAQKQRWSNFPDGAFSRAGLQWKTLSDPQKQAWLTLMSTTLSKQGYQRVLNEWYADDALAASEGGGANFGVQYYWIAIIGTPSTTTPWQWQFGGHHITVNATVAKTNITLAPSFIGDQPASYKDANGNTIVPLGDIDNTAIALLNSLDATQKTKAILGNTTIDLVLGPGQDGRKIPSEGLVASAMTAEQQNTLLILMGYYGNMLNDEDAAVRMADLKSHLADTYFAWYGPTSALDTGYFRITGPTVVIEYSPQGAGRGGSGTASNNHVHGMYRDPTNDYGVAIIKQ